MARHNLSSTQKNNLLWLDLTIYGSKLDQYTLLENYYTLRTSQKVNPERLLSDSIDIILVEYDYPIKDSLEILSDIKASYSSIPIIMLTEQHSEELAVWAFRARVWDFFVKPLAQDKLLASMETILEFKNNSTQQESRSPATPPNIKPMDTRFININEEYLAIAPALSFLDGNYSKKISETTLASLCGMNPFRFSRCFKKEIGVTLQEYIVRLRIREALRLLDNPSASITDIALMVGFNDTSYFSRTFKKYMNYSPSEFRNLQADNANETNEHKQVDVLSMVPDCIKSDDTQQDDWTLLQHNIKLMNDLGQQVQPEHGRNRKLNS